MKQFYTNLGFNFKSLLSFVGKLPSGSSYAMRR